MKKPDEAVKRHGAETAERLMAFIAAVEEAGEALTDAEAQRLAQVPGVDAGELVLIPLAARETTGFFVTGDKNALRALATEPRCAPFATRLAGRVVSLDQLLEALLFKHGFDWLHARVSAAANLDRGVSMIVAPGISASEESARQGFASFVGNLRSETGNLLVPKLP